MKIKNPVGFDHATAQPFVPAAVERLLVDWHGLGR